MKYIVTLEIEGMQCGMCEAHVCDAIRGVCDENAKVSASYRKGCAQIIMEGSPDIARIKSEVKKTGYRVKNVHAEPVN